MLLKARHPNRKSPKGIAIARVSLLLATLGLSGTFATAETPDSCIPWLSYLPLDVQTVGADSNGVAALGTYERISPDGRFILRSYSGAKLGKVSLMELPASQVGAVRAYQTPFSNEAFPVQGTWRYLVDVNGEHYRFKDVLNQHTAARPLFRAGMTGFYAAASEMPARREVVNEMAGQASGNGDGASIFIRSLSWPQDANSDNQGTGPLQVSTVEIADNGRSAKVLRTLGPQFICQGRQSIDGNVYALPMISIDGREFSAMPQAPEKGQPSMRVYGLASSASVTQHPCDLRVDMGLSPSKAVFGYATEGRAPEMLTYSDLGSVYVFDRSLNQSFRLDHARHRVQASAFPGLTRDGRVIYGATWRDCPDSAKCPEHSGYVVVDPYQSHAYRQYWASVGRPAPRQCITERDVSRVREEFARFHGLPN